MLRRTTQSGTDVIPVARCETSGWVPESLHRSGEAPKYQVHRINQTESTHRIKYVGASPLRYLLRTIPDVSHRATCIASVPD
jgi:hypothetical protein